jgi:hypothetical protein
MVEIGALRIRRGIYKFEAHKRYQFVLRYKVIQRSGLDKLKESLSAFLAPKKTASPASAAAAKEAPAPGGFNPLPIVAAFVIALLLVVGGLMLLMPNLSQGPITVEPVEKALLSDKVAYADVLTAGPRGSDDHVVMLLIDYNASGIENYSVSIKTYDDALPTEVFVLNSERVEASRYSDFLTALRKDLGSTGVVVNEISFAQLETVPKGAEVIIPSGVLPEELLSGKGNITRLMKAGVVVVYIGQSFKSVLNGTLVKTTPEDQFESAGMAFDESSAPSCTDNFTLFQPLYQVAGATMAYGCVSVVRLANGTMLFVPQTIDGGWRSDPVAAARDIARIVVETPWASPDNAGSSYSLSAENQSTGISGTRLFFSLPYTGRERSVKVSFYGLTPRGSSFQDMKTLRAGQAARGELYVPQLSVTSTKVTGEPIRMNANLEETNPASPSMFLLFTASNGTEVLRSPRGNINTQAQDVNLDVEIPVDQGEYMVSLEDDSGTTYASTYLNVQSVSISGPYPGAKQALYTFQVDTPVTLNTLTVELDGGSFKKDFNDVSAGQLSVDVSQYTGGDALAYGNHTFVFTAGDFQKALTYSRAMPPPPFPPELLLVVLLAGGIMGIGLYFARQEKVFFSIDVPDFPPVSRTKIPLNTETVLSVFDRVNTTYRWEFTPLVASEVKNGFKNMYFRGNPIFITDYNTEFLLNQLVRMRKVKEFLDYYGLEEWEKKSGHSVRYLAMLRKLRDICVNNAIPFTQLGESEVCDSEMTVVGQQMFLHFYDKTNAADVLSRALVSLGKGITIVLFKDNAEKGEFAGQLNSITKAPLVMKLEVEANSVMLLTYPELEKMVQEFKGV